MLHRLVEDRREAVEALTLQYVLGVISESVFTASLRGHIDRDEIRHLVLLNQIAHQNSLPYRRMKVQSL